MATTISSEAMEQSPNSERTKKMVLYIGIFSIVMLFAGFSSAYVISSYNEVWVNLSLPFSFYVSTALILISSLTIRAAVKASNFDNEKKATTLLSLTVLLGIGFGLSQISGWNELIGKGIFTSSHIDNLDGVYGTDYTISFKGQELIFENGEYYQANDDLREKPMLDEIAVYSNASGSYMFLLSFVHVLHVIGGLIFLFVLLLKTKFGKERSLSKIRLRLGAIYWHFVDGLWIYLLLFLLLIH